MKQNIIDGKQSPSQHAHGKPGKQKSLGRLNIDLSTASYSAVQTKTPLGAASQSNLLIQKQKSGETLMSPKQSIGVKKFGATMKAGPTGSSFIGSYVKR